MHEPRSGLRRFSILLPILAAMTLSGCGPEQRSRNEPPEVVRAFLGSLDEHDVEGALAHLDDNFVFRSSDGGFEAGKESMPSMLAWDAAAGSDVEVRELTSSGDTVRVLLVERNRFTELLELEPWVVEATFVVREGLIVEEVAREVTVDRPPLTRRFERALEPVRRWAVEARPDEAKAVFADGGVARYDGPTARRLLALIEAYHLGTAEGR